MAEPAPGALPGSRDPGPRPGAVGPETIRVAGAGGVTLAGCRWQAPTETGVVMLLHGGGQTRHSWAQTGSRLAASGWSCVSLDARGHGESDWAPDGDYSLDAQVADLLEALRGLEIASAVLVGASLGGATSLLVGGERRGIASALVLVDVVARPEPEGLDRIYEFMTAFRDGFASLEEASAAVARYSTWRRRSSSLEGLRKNLRLREDGRWYWHWDPRFVAPEGRRPASERLRHAATRVTVPTLLVRGGRSDVVSPEGLADMQQLIPHAEAVDVRDAGHMVAGDDNDVFGDALLSFVASLRRRPGIPSPAGTTGAEPPAP